MVVALLEIEIVARNVAVYVVTQIKRLVVNATGLYS